MTNEELLALFPNGETRKVKVPKGRVLTSGGWQDLTTTRVCGSFQGKAGSIRRSRKGRTYHAPNGSRYYPAWQENEAIAYVLNNQ